MTLLGSQDLEAVGEKERLLVGVSGSGCLTRQDPESRLGCPSPATQASPRGEGVVHQVTRKVASRRCGMAPAAACRNSGAGVHGAGAFEATMARAKCPAHIAPKHALRCVRAGRRRALSVLTHSRPPDRQPGPASLGTCLPRPLFAPDGGGRGRPILRLRRL